MVAWIKVRDILLSLSGLLFFACSPRTETVSVIEPTDLPKWTWPVLTHPSFQEKYTFYLTTNPFYLQADFDHDGFLDIAVLIKEKASGKLGLGLLRQQESKLTVLGAGEKKSLGGENWKWLRTWKTEAVLPAGSRVRPAGAVLILFPQEKDQDAPWLFWNGQNWEWKKD